MPDFIKKTYINREYSWLKFNERVLEEALCDGNPLLEKGKFLSIFTSNRDEFCMVRVGSLLNDSVLNPKDKDNKTDLTPAEQMDGVYAHLKKLYTAREKVAKNILKELNAVGLRVQNARSQSVKAGKRFQKYFKTTLLPLMNPIVLDNKHPMIHFENLKMYVVARLEQNGKKFFGVLLRVGGFHPPKLPEIDHLLKNGPFRVKPPFLGEITDTADVFFGFVSVYGYGSRIHRKYIHYNTYCSGLSRTVPTKQTESLAAFRAKR